MASAEDSRSARAADQPTPDADPLIALEQRLERAEQAAERLIAEATAAAMRRPPPSGWQRREPDHGDTADPEGQPRSDPSDGRDATGEIDLLLEAVRALRDRIPPDLQRRLAEALREVLIALRALIDWYLERAERQRTESTEVRDIPIL